MTRQVICINWGTKYGPAFVNRLYGMVARNLAPPFRFVCFTDRRDGIRPEVECHDLPPLDVEMPVNTRGIWPRARLWGPRLADLTGPVLFLDLDIVITGPIDDLFTHGDPGRVTMMRSPTHQFANVGQTSVFRFPVGALQPLQAAFRADPQGVADRWRFEQIYVTRNVPGGADFFPWAWLQHLRQNCRRPFPMNYLAPPRLPRDARIVIFPGDLGPAEAISGAYRDGAPPRGPMAHLRARRRERAFGPWRYLRHFRQPAPWVGDHWRP
ncbi:MAG: glycosyl transferase [Paracoccaceae bacterium]